MVKILTINNSHGKELEDAINEYIDFKNIDLNKIINIQVNNNVQAIITYIE